MSEELVNFFKAFADTNRLKIVGLLADKPYSVEELAELLNLKPSTISHHLARLTKAGLEKKSLINPADNSEVEFGKMFYMIHSMRSGKHHPDGVLWIMNGKHKVVSEKISLMRIAPTILSYFNVPTPDYMQEPPLSIAS